MGTEVLLIFHCRDGQTESLALAAAVGSVQSRANIRLRRLRDCSQPEGEPGPEFARMCREYVPPTEADLLRANAIVFAAAPDFEPSAPEWAPCVDLLHNLGSAGKLSGKVAVVLARSESAMKSLSALAAQTGLRILNEPGDAMSQGRRVAAAATQFV